MGCAADNVHAIRISLMACANSAPTSANRALLIALGMLALLIMRADPTFGQRLDGMNVVPTLEC
jgi:hypothetical protein